MKAFGAHLEEFDGCCVVPVSSTFTDDLEPSGPDGVDDGSSVGRVLHVPDFQDGAIISIAVEEKNHKLDLLANNNMHM